MGIGLADVDLSAISIGDVEIVAVSLGDTQIWPPVPSNDEPFINDNSTTDRSS